MFAVSTSTSYDTILKGLANCDHLLGRKTWPLVGWEGALLSIAFLSQIASNVLAIEACSCV